VVPLQLHLRFGQWSTLLLLASVGTWLGLARRSAPLGGAALAALGAIKVVPFGLVVVALVRRDWRTSAWAAVVGVVALGASQVLAPGSLGDFLASGSRTSDVYSTAFGNGSVPAASTRLFAGSGWIDPLVHAPTVGLVVGWVLVAGVVALTAAALRRTDDVGLQVATVTVALLLVSPVTWRHADVLLLLPVIVLVGGRFPRRTATWVLLGLAAALSLVDHWSFMRAHRPTAELVPLPWTAQLRSPGTTILLLVLAACVLAAGRQHAAGTAAGVPIEVSGERSEPPSPPPRRRAGRAAPAGRAPRRGRPAPSAGGRRSPPTPPAPRP
jgi:hypothetical protein